MADILALAQLVLVAIVAGGFNAGIIMQVEAQLPPPPSSSPSCSAALATLSPCLSFLTGNNNPGTSPTQTCCSAVSYVSNSSAICLCPLFTGNSSSNILGFPVNNIPLPLNQTRALTLPGACQISTPLLSQCQVSSGQGGAPVATPVSGPATAPLTTASSPRKRITKSPATSVSPSALPPATTVGVVSPSQPPATSGALPPTTTAKSPATSAALPPTTTAKSPATSAALPPTTATTGVLSPLGNHVKPAGSDNAGSMMSFSLRSMLMVGLINIIVRIA